MICNFNNALPIDYAIALKSNKMNFKEASSKLLEQNLTGLDNFEDILKLQDGFLVIHSSYLNSNKIDEKLFNELTNIVNELINDRIISLRVKSIQESVKQKESTYQDLEGDSVLAETPEHFDLENDLNEISEMNAENKSSALINLLSKYFNNDYEEFQRFTDLMTKRIVDFLFFDLKSGTVITPKEVNNQFYKMMDTMFKEMVSLKDELVDLKSIEITDLASYEAAKTALLRNDNYKLLPKSKLYFFTGFKSFLEKELFNISDLFVFDDKNEFQIIHKRQSTDNVIIEKSELNAEKTSSSFFTHMVETTPILVKIPGKDGFFVDTQRGYLTKASLGFINEELNKAYRSLTNNNFINADPIEQLKLAFENLISNSTSFSDIKNKVIATSFYNRFLADNNSLYAIYKNSDNKTQKEAALNMLTAITHEIMSTTLLTPGVIEVDPKTNVLNFKKNEAGSGINQRIFEDFDSKLITRFFDIAGNQFEEDRILESSFGIPINDIKGKREVIETTNERFDNAVKFLKEEIGLDLESNSKFEKTYKEFINSNGYDSDFKKATVEYSEKLLRFYQTLIKLYRNPNDSSILNTMKLIFDPHSKKNLQGFDLFKKAVESKKDDNKMLTELFKAFRKNGLSKISSDLKFFNTVDLIFDIEYSFSPKSVYNSVLATQSARLNVQSIAGSHKRIFSRINHAIIKQDATTREFYDLPTASLKTDLVNDIIKLDGSSGGQVNLSHRSFTTKDNFEVNFLSMWLNKIADESENFLYFDPVADSDKSLDAIIEVKILKKDTTSATEGNQALDRDFERVDREIEFFQSSISSYYQNFARKIIYEYALVFEKELGSLKTNLLNTNTDTLIQHLNTINEFLLANNITSDVLTERFSDIGLEALDHIHGVFGKNTDDDGNPISVQLNPHFLENLTVFKDKEAVLQFLSKELQNDVKLLEKSEINSFIAPESIVEKMSNKDKEKFLVDKKNSSNELFIFIKKDDNTYDVNPLYRKYFFQWNLVSKNALYALAGPYFSDKGKTQNERYLASIKRMNGFVSPSKLYVTDIPGGLPSEIYELTMQDDKVEIQYPNSSKTMDHADGAAYGLASTARKEVNSLGGIYGTAPGLVVKDFNPSLNPETGLVSLDKRAKPTITNEMIRMTAGDGGPRDLGNVVKMLYSADPKKAFENGFVFTKDQAEKLNNLHQINKLKFEEGTGKPVIVKAGIVANKTYNSMYEIWEDLGGAYSVKTVTNESDNFDFEINGSKYKFTDFEEIPQTTKDGKLLFPGDMIVEIEKEIEQLNNSYLSNFIRTSARKRGNKNVITVSKFNQLLDGIEKGEQVKIPFSEQNQKTAGVQMSTSKEYEDKELTLSTQSIGAIGLGAYEPEEAQDAYLALKSIILNGISQELRLDADDPEFKAFLYQLLDEKQSETTIGTIASGILDFAKSKNILPTDHPQLYKNVNTKIAALISGDSIRQKLEGSQLVLIPAGKVIRTKNFVIDSTTLDAAIRNPKEFEDLLTDLTTKYKELNPESEHTYQSIGFFLKSNGKELLKLKSELKGAELYVYEDGKEVLFNKSKEFLELYNQLKNLTDYENYINKLKNQKTKEKDKEEIRKILQTNEIYKDLFSIYGDDAENVKKEKTILLKDLDAKLAKLADKAAYKKGDVYYDSKNTPVFRSSPGETIVPFIQINAYKKYGVKKGMSIEEIRNQLKINASKSVQEAFEAQLLSTNERIPLQSMASMMYNRTVAFLYNMDASGMVNNEHQNSTGGDFDVDKTNHSIFSVVKDGRLSAILQHLGLKSGDLIPFYGTIEKGKIKPSDIRNLYSKNYKYDNFATFISEITELIQSLKPDAIKDFEITDELKNKLILEFKIAANKNYLLFKKMAITASPKTLTVRTTPVNMDDIDTIVENIPKSDFDIKTNLSANSPASVNIMKFQNQSAKEVVGIVAASLKSLALIQHAAGLALNNKEELKYLKIKPIGIDNNVYSSLSSEINFKGMSIEEAIDILHTLEELSLKIENLIDEEKSEEVKNAIVKYNNVVKNYDFLGELLNSAVDNAKELKLAIINAGNKTVGLYIAYTFLGVDPKKIGEIMTDPQIDSLLKTISDSIYRKGVGISTAIKGNDKLDYLKPIYLLSEEISLMSSILGINQGLKSTGYQLYSYRNKLNDFYKKVQASSGNSEENIEAFDFDLFLNNENYRNLLISKTQAAINDKKSDVSMNLFYFLSKSDHFMEYFKTAIEQHKAAKKTSFKDASLDRFIDIMHKRKFIDKNYINEKDYNTIIKMMDDLAVSLYYDTNPKSINIGDTEYDLSNEIDRNAFIELMNNVYIPMLKVKYQDNFFIQSLSRNSSKPNLFGEVDINYRMVFDINNVNAEQQMIEQIKYYSAIQKLKDESFNGVSIIEAFIHFNRLVNREGMNQESFTKFLPITEESVGYYNFLDRLRSNPSQFIRNLENLSDNDKDSIFQALSLKFNHIGTGLREKEDVKVKGNKRLFVLYDEGTSLYKSNLRIDNQKEYVENQQIARSVDSSWKDESDVNYTRYVSITSSTSPKAKPKQKLKKLSTNEIQDKIKKIDAIENIIVNC